MITLFLLLVKYRKNHFICQCKWDLAEFFLLLYIITKFWVLEMQNKISPFLIKYLAVRILRQAWIWA